MASWEPVNRLRVRFELAVGFEVVKTCSSEEEPRLDEDSVRRRSARIGAMVARGGGMRCFIQAERGSRGDATRL